MSYQPRIGSSRRRLIGLVLLALGLALAIPFGYEIMVSARESAGWPQTAGSIRESELISIEQRDGSEIYRARIVYAYGVDGRDYEGERIRFGTEGSASPVRDRAEDWVDKYRSGNEVMVYYDPHSPSEAVLEPGAHMDAYVLLGLGILLAVAGFVIVARPS